MDRWKRQDLIKKGSLASRAFGFLCSIMAFVTMASNQHGDWKQFDHYEEYRYVVAAAVVSTLYTGLQSLRQIYEIYTHREVLSSWSFAVVDFGGDQTVAYLLISAASSAIPLTNRMIDNAFTDASAAAISMAIFAFVSMAISSLISGYKLSKQSSI